MADLAYALAGEEIGRVRCDGLVVATPQGSTGYNLANGGPVLAWGVEGYVVSFIAPHSLTARALVVAPSGRAHDQQRVARGAGRGPRRRPPDARAAARRGHPRRVRPHARHAGPAPGRVASTTACASASAAWRASHLFAGAISWPPVWPRNCNVSVPKLCQFCNNRRASRAIRRAPLVDPSACSTNCASRTSC